MRVRITVSKDMAARILETSAKVPTSGGRNRNGLVVSYVLWYAEHMMRHYGEPLDYASMMARVCAPDEPRDLDTDQNFSGVAPIGAEIH